MNQEKRQCQSCKQNFTIAPEDFRFYEKIQVPPPTWCPECRLIRRMTWRSEMSLYKRTCDFSGKEIISQYPAGTKFPVYDTSIFYSRDWTPPFLGYDLKRKFFEQFRNLLLITPRAALLTDIQSIRQGSEYQNSSSRNKNCYLVFASGDNENCLYGKSVDYCKDCVDNFFIRKSELCYQCVDCFACSRLFYSQDCESCLESYFLFDCRNTSHSYGCVGLRNKSYCIFNKQYSKEGYKQFIASRKILIQPKEFLDLIDSYPHRFAKIENSINANGNYIYRSRNIYHSFIAYDSQFCRYSFKIVGCKDSYDLTDWGDPAELVYECITVGKNAYNCKFSNNCWPNCYNVEYSDSCSSSHDIFGCVSLKNASFCILNKQYQKEEYLRLRDKIIDNMMKNGEYGEFFPSKLSPFTYNETIAQEYFPLTKEEALERGYSWEDTEPRNYKIQISNNKLPDHIQDVKDEIIGQIIGCQHEGRCKEQCTSAFRIIPQELKFYRQMNIPLPRLCPNCRHYQRIKQRNPLKLWHRSCQCAGMASSNAVHKNTARHFHGEKPCPNEFETTYSPERKEIVYCEKCYIAEVV